jgi:hypothetical protein
MINSILFFLTLLITISKFDFYKIPGIKTFHLVAFFGLKSLASLMIWMYFFYKPEFGSESDMYQFFNIAERLHYQLNFIDELKLIFGVPTSDVSQTILSSTEYWSKLNNYGVINDNRIMIRINMLIRFFSGGSYVTHSLLFDFLGFNGLFLLIKIIRMYTQNNILLITSILFLAPSGLTWTSNMFKETVLLFSIAGASYFLVQIWHSDKKIFYATGLLLFVLLLIQTKPLFSLLFLYSFICYSIHRFVKSKVNMANFFAFFFVPLIAFIVLTSLLPLKTNDEIIRKGGTVHLPLLLKNKQDDFLFDIRMFKPGTVLTLNRIDGTYVSVLKTIPDALHNIFVAPFKGCLKKWELIPFALEISFLLILFILHLKFPEINHRPFKDELNMILYPSILSLLVIGLIIPIEGLLIKYSAPPILLILAVLAVKVDWKKAFPSKLA